LQIVGQADPMLQGCLEGTVGGGIRGHGKGWGHPQLAIEDSLEWGIGMLGQSPVRLGQDGNAIGCGLRPKAFLGALP
jgi:hypothetical protein